MLMSSGFFLLLTLAFAILSLHLLHLFQALLEFGSFHRFRFCQFYLFQQFLIINKLTDHPGLEDRDQGCDEIIVAQS